MKTNKKMKLLVAIRQDRKSSPMLFSFGTRRQAEAFIKDIKKAYPKSEGLIGVEGKEKS